jgi:hypothetical protein
MSPFAPIAEPREGSPRLRKPHIEHHVSKSGRHGVLVLVRLGALLAAGERFNPASALILLLIHEPYRQCRIQQQREI